MSSCTNAIREHNPLFHTRSLEVIGSDAFVASGGGGCGVSFCAGAGRKLQELATGSFDWMRPRLPTSSSRQRCRRLLKVMATSRPLAQCTHRFVVCCLYWRGHGPCKGSQSDCPALCARILFDALVHTSVSIVWRARQSRPPEQPSSADYKMQLARPVLVGPFPVYFCSGGFFEDPWSKRPWHPPSSAFS